MNYKALSILLVLILIASMTLTVSAASPRILAIDPGLTFDGTTAQCTLNVCCDHLTDSIFASIKLYKGSTCVQTWTRSASGFLNFYDEVNAVKNAEYTLEVVVTINGVRKPTFTVTNTCE